MIDVVMAWKCMGIINNTDSSDEVRSVAQIEKPKAIYIFAVLNPFILKHVGRITVALNVRANPNIYI